MSRRRGPSARICVVAELRDLTAVQQLLNDLPVDVFGQVYIASDAGIWPLTAPSRVQVSWLLPRPGALCRALTAWSAEWLTDPTGSAADVPLVWIFPGAAAVLSAEGSEGVTRVITALPDTHVLQGHDGPLPPALEGITSRLS